MTGEGASPLSVRPSTDMQFGFVIDHRKCIGCHACTVACKSENDVPLGSFRTWVKYSDVGTFPNVKRHFAVLRCNQCTNAPCVTICPVNALEKRDDGIVDLDREACIGCKACMQACPYDALYLNEDTGGAEKCHYCAHRTEQGLEPACAVVCPEEAIVAGDLHDPDSRVAKLAAREDAMVRRPEQQTGPNVFYVGTDPVTLNPGAANEPETWLWSERQQPPPDWPTDRPVQDGATTVLNVDHPVYWTWRVDAYLVTKGIAGGAAMLAWLPAAFGRTDAFATWIPEAIALAFLSITMLLLIFDLKRPKYFYRLLTRPNWSSWLVKGGVLLGAFGGCTAAILAARILGFGDAADLLRVPNALLGLGTAIYTAWLFAQCEGRDLWQHKSTLAIHLAGQALFLGALALLPGALPGGDTTTLGWALVGFASLGGFLHLGMALQERSRTGGHSRHDTDNAAQARSLLNRIPLWEGVEALKGFGAFRTGVTMSTGALVLLVLAATAGFLSAPVAVLVILISIVGLFAYERAFVRAGQLPPLS